jgi:hypothetical protein
LDNTNLGIRDFEICEIGGLKLFVKKEWQKGDKHLTLNDRKQNEKLFYGLKLFGIL